jgi:hypothetical protein
MSGKGLNFPTMIIQGVGYYEVRMSSQEGMIKIDEGSLRIDRNTLNFSGTIKTVVIPLSDIEKIIPYDTSMIGICKKKRQRHYNFMWGNNAEVKFLGATDDDVKVKPLTGNVVAQFINQFTKI